jgi:hypothetical protein
MSSRRAGRAASVPRRIDRGDRGRIAIAAYLGSGPVFDEAIGDFAAA